MVVRIKRLQPPSYYLYNYKIPLLTDLALYVRDKWDFWINKYDSKDILFRNIEIETVNKCNNDCPFCPASVSRDTRKFAELPEWLFLKILDELKELNFEGEIRLWHNNEPLLDKRLERFIEHTKVKLPSAEISIWTNGLILTFSRLLSLYRAGLRYLLIDSYGDELSVPTNISSILERIRGSEIERDMEIIVWLRYKDVRLANRGGINSAVVGEKTNYLTQKRLCDLPFITFFINSEGFAHICCNDVYYSHVVGNVGTESIVDIWKRMSVIREEIVKTGRANLIPCMYCDKP